MKIIHIKTATLICQMAVATPKHILKCLSEREPYYQATGTEPEPSPWGDEVLKSGGDLVYCYIPESTAPYVIKLFIVFHYFIYW